MLSTWYVSSVVEELDGYSSHLYIAEEKTCELEDKAIEYI